MTVLGRPDYQERKEVRIERLRAGAIRKAKEADAGFDRARTIASMIPMGQPILVGHHSEVRHRKDIARIDSLSSKAIEASRAAESMASRADAAESNRAISSDDPEAIDKLREKLAAIEDKRAQGVAINKIIRSAQGDSCVAVKNLMDFGVSKADAIAYLAGDCFGNLGVAPYKLSGLSGETRRIEKRIALLERVVAAPPHPDEKIGDVLITERDNRVQLIFPGKPDCETRTRLKRNGFRWSPTSGAWQRMASPQAWVVAREILR